MFRVSLFTIVPFCGFYTVKLGFSPVYLTFAIALLALLAGSFYRVRLWKDDSLANICTLFILYLSVLFLAAWDFDSPLPSAWFNLTFSLVYFIVVAVVLENSTRTRVVRASELAIVFSIVLLTIECFYRITHPADPEDMWAIDRDDIFWYVYKTSSFMYPDSNSVGLFISCMFCFILGLRGSERQRFNKYMMPLAILLLGSLSRAAILATGIVFFYQYATGSRFRMALFASALGALTLGVLAWIATDESFLSKFWIAGLVAVHLSQADPLQLLIGVGPGNAETVLGVGAHLLPFTVLVELGILGSILTIALWYLILRKAGRSAVPLVFAFVLNGLSFTTFAIPWLYAMAAILIYLNRKVPVGSTASRFRPSSSLQR